MRPGFSMPPASPLYEMPPYHFKGNRSVNIVFRTTPEALRALTPDPLLPNPHHLAFFYVGEYLMETPLKNCYKEAGVGIPVSYSDTEGNYMVYLYLDPACAIVPGREIWGLPRKDANIAFEETPEGFTATVSRAGITLVTAAMKHGKRIDHITAQPNIPSFNLKMIPSVKRGCPPDVMQITATTVSTVKRELYRGSASLAFDSTPSDPLGRLPIVEILGGEFTLNDFVLDYGDVIFDYLKEPRYLEAALMKDEGGRY